MAGSEAAGGDADTAAFTEIVEILNRALLAGAKPEDMIRDVQGRQGAPMPYKLSLVMAAMMFVLGSYAAQFGSLDTPKRRREFTDKMTDLFNQSFKHVERELQNPAAGSIN